MKKTVSVFLSVFILLISLFVPACAETDGEEIEYFEDGAYITVGFKEYFNDSDISVEGESEGAETNLLDIIIRIFRKIIELFSGSKTVEKTKYITYFDSKGKILWRFYIKGEFSYNGKQAQCKKAEAYCDIYDSDWSLISKSSAKKDNTAQGSVVIRQYKLAVPLKTIEKNLILTCDRNGNIS